MSWGALAKINWCLRGIRHSTLLWGCIFIKWNSPFQSAYSLEPKPCHWQHFTNDIHEGQHNWTAGLNTVFLMTAIATQGYLKMVIIAWSRQISRISAKAEAFNEIHWSKFRQQQHSRAQLRINNIHDPSSYRVFQNLHQAESVKRQALHVYLCTLYV